MPETDRRLLLLDEADNVVAVARPVAAGERVVIEDATALVNCMISGTIAARTARETTLAINSGRQCSAGIPSPPVSVLHADAHVPCSSRTSITAFSSTGRPARRRRSALRTRRP